MAARAARCGSATPQGGEGCARRRGAQGRGSAMVFALRAGAAVCRAAGNVYSSSLRCIAG